jgi:putative acetyltransferase
MDIRTELDSDIPSIRKVTIEAFGRESEADLLDSLRLAGDLLLSLVAEEDGAIVGHVAYSPAVIHLTRGDSADAVALGPISVVPDVQSRGIGSRLIERGFRDCLAMGYELMFLLGHPAYYPRFGFVPAKPLGVRWAVDTSDQPNPAFMVKELKEGALAAALGGDTGVFQFAPAFDD